MIFCEINNIRYRIQTDLSITEHIGNRTVTNISILVEDQAVPIAGDIVRIFDITNEVRTDLFLGTCGLPSSPRYNNFLEPRIYKIKCRNANSIMGNRVANTAEQNVTLTQLITDIYNIYIAGEGISLGTLGDFDDINVTAYVANDKPVDEVLNELAGITGAVWNISPDLTFSFMRATDFTTFTQEINTTFAPFRNFNHKTKDLDVRTVQIVNGARERTTEQTESFTYEQDQTEFTVTFPLSQRPRLFINNVEVATDRIGINGIDTGNPNIAFFYSFGSNRIIYNTDSGLLSVGNTLRIQYIGEFTIRTRVADDAAIADLAARTGFSGVIERSVQNSSIRSIEDSRLFANGLLEEFSQDRNELKCTVDARNLAKRNLTINDFPLMKILNFNLPDLGITGPYVITERKITVQSAADAINNLTAELHLKDRNFLRSYAESIKNLDRDIRDITVREDEVIVQNQDELETITFSELIDIQFQNAYFPVEAGGDPVDPFHLSGDLGGGVYPV